MIRVNMHEAKSRLSELVRSVEEDGEVVLLCRNGVEIAKITGSKPKPAFNRLAVHPKLQGRILYDPTAPATQDEWPEEFR